MILCVKAIPATQWLRIRGLISRILLGLPLGLRNKRTERRAKERFVFHGSSLRIAVCQHAVHCIYAVAPITIVLLFQVVAVELISFIIAVFQWHRIY